MAKKREAAAAPDDPIEQLQRQIDDLRTDFTDSPTQAQYNRIGNFVEEQFGPWRESVLQRLAFIFSKIGQNGENVDPATIRQQVLDALAGWQQQVNQTLAALGGRLDGSEQQVAAVKAALDALQTQLAGFDAVAVLARLTQAEGQIAGAQTRVLTLEAVVDELRARLAAIPPGADPEQVKQAVLDALATWRSEVEARLTHLDQCCAESQTRFADHEARLQDLLARIEALPVAPDLEAFKKQILAELAVWQNQTNGRLEQLRADLDKLASDLQSLIQSGVDLELVKTLLRDALAQLQEEWADDLAKIPGLEARLAALESQISNTPGGLTQAEVVALLDAALATFRADIQTQTDALRAADAALNQRVAALETALVNLPPGLTTEQVRQLVLDGLGTLSADLASLRAENAAFGQRLATLETALANLPPGLTTEQVRQLIADALAALQTQWTSDLAALRAKDTALDGDIADLRRQIVEIRTNPPGGGGPPPISLDDVRNAVLAALAEWKSSVDTALATLRADFTAFSNSTTADLGDLKNWRTDWAVKLSDAQQKLLAQELLIGNLTTSLGALQTQFGAVNWAELNPEQIRTRVLEVLAAWQQQVLALIAGLEGRVEVRFTEFNSLITSLETRLLERIEQATKVEVIQNIVIQTLNEWRVSMDQRINQQTVLIDTLRAEYEAFKAVVEVWQGPLSAIRDEYPGWKAEVATQLADLQTQIDTQQAAWTAALAQLNTDWAAQIATLEAEIEALRNNPPNEVAQRVARRLTQGRGIVQGLVVSHTPERFNLRISAGVGITSEGYVLEWAGGDFTHYRIVQCDDWPEWLREQTFLFKQKNDATKGHHEVYELLAKRGADKDPDVRPLTPGDGSEVLAPFVTDKVVLALRVPPTAEEAESVRFVLIARPVLLQLIGAASTVENLLGSHPDADNVFGERYTEADDIPYESDLYRALQPELTLREAPLHRFGFWHPEECSTAELDTPNYPDALTLDKIYAAYVAIVDEDLKRVESEMTKVLELYRVLLFPHSDAKTMLDGVRRARTKWEAFKRYNQRNPGKHRKYHVQYFYDWTRDLINGYHELRGELQVLLSNTNLLDAAFAWATHPQHLLLGVAWRPFDPGTDAPLRHTFVQPPVFNGQAARLETCRIYLRRWLEQAEQFYLPRYTDDPALNPFAADDATVQWHQLKITPSRRLGAPLSEQSPAYYYPLFNGVQSLQNVWNYRRTKNQTADHILNYHANDSDDSYTQRREAVRPLYYVLDPYDFYRVEGHVGQLAVNSNRGQWAVVEQLRELRDIYNLDFSVVATDTTVAGAEITRPNEQGVPTQYSVHYPLPAMIGMEHLGGVPKGGTLVLVVDAGVVVADFAVPYRITETT